MAQSHRETRGRQGKCQWFITTPAVLHAEADNPECSFPTGKQIQVTWMHPRSHHWHLIDYVLTRQRNLRSVRHIRAVRGSEAWSDHRFVKCTVFMSAKSPKRQHGRSAVKKLDVCKLQDATMQAKLQSSLSEALADSSTDELAHIQENCVRDKCQGDQLPEVASQGLV